MTTARLVWLLATVCLCASSEARQKRALTLDDHSRVMAVADPQRSPEGQWVAYTVTTVDAEKDRRDTDVWMVKWDGSERRRLTSSPDSETTPRWSPDGRYLAFLAARGSEDEKKRGPQVWLLDRAGGEAERITDVRGGVSDIQWSPDSTRLAFVVRDEDPDAEPEKKAGWARRTPPPIVIDRYRFKQDREGYLRHLYDHIAVLTLATRAVETVTSGRVDDRSPSWSPDGRRIAFLSKRAHAEPDRTNNTDVWVVEARVGAVPAPVTATAEAESGRPAWSPDGTRLAVLIGADDRLGAYGQTRLAVVPSGPDALPVAAPAVLLAGLDRAVTSPVWSEDGERLSFLVQDDRRQQVATVAVNRPAGGGIERLTSGNRAVRAISPGRDGHSAVLVTTPAQPAEVFALEGGSLRQLTRHNDPLLSEIALGITEDFQSRSRDGTEVHGVMVKPASYTPGRRYPTVLLVHGGPNAQDEHAFSFDREFLAARGFLVLAINYRGSAGRGAAYQQAIAGDWGRLEVMDLLGAVDEAVRAGLADPERLGIAGWSYGGISTTYVIASDPRFKAAISGAGAALWASLYGVDQYIVQYEQELGLPWRTAELWTKLSYPFFHVERIRTPTLFLGGEKDFNVPIAGGEQMYQALRSLGVPTELVIYPGQFHGLTVPSYERDRLARYAAWFERYLGTGGASSPRP